METIGNIGNWENMVHCGTLWYTVVYCCIQWYTVVVAFFVVFFTA